MLYGHSFVYGSSSQSASELVGVNLGIFRRFPNSRRRVSTPPIISRSKGAFRETNKAGFHPFAPQDSFEGGSRPPPAIAVIGSLAKPVPPWTRIFCQSPLPTIPMSPFSWIRTPVFFLRASIRTTAPVIPAMTIHTVSAHGGRIPVVHSLACLPEAILVMRGVG